FLLSLFFNDHALYVLYTLSLHDALPIYIGHAAAAIKDGKCEVALIVYGSTQRSDKSRNNGIPPILTAQYESPFGLPFPIGSYGRSEEHTSELQSRFDLVCRLLLEKKKIE